MERKIVCPKTGEVIRKSEIGPKGCESRFLTEFTEIEKIGRGGYGVVVKCVNKLDKKEYAIKKVVMDADEAFYDVVISEVLCLSEITHDNVVRYFSAWVEPSTVGEYEDSDGSVAGEDNDEAPCLFIQMELCTTSLDKLIYENNSSLDIEEIWSFFKQILCGLDHLHSKEIRHGDLKPSNIFLKGKIVKIGDFGLACTSKEASKLPIACGIYRAPELKSSEKPFTLFSDIYSLGLIVLEMIVGAEFSTDQERVEVLGDVQKRSEYLERKKLNATKKDLIERLLMEDYTQRLSAAQILMMLGV